MGSYIITGTTYDFRVQIQDGTNQTKYFNLLNINGNSISQELSSPSLTNIKYGDLIFFNQEGNESDFELGILTTNVEAGVLVDNL